MDTQHRLPIALILTTLSLAFAACAPVEIADVSVIDVGDGVAGDTDAVDMRCAGLWLTRARAGAGRERKARVEDALNATRAAIEEGVVAGGGVALLRASKALDGIEVEGEQLFDVNIARKVVETPLRQIVENAGLDASIVVDKVRNLKGANGFNAQTEEYVDMIKDGVIDATKVVRIALQNAASVASLMLTTDALVAEKQKEEDQAAAGGGM